MPTQQDRKRTGAPQPPPPSQSPSPSPHGTAKADTFPIISAMEKADFRKCKALIEEMRELKEQAAAIEQQQADAKAAMIGLHEKYKGWPGFRYGTTAVYFAQKTRKTLDVKLLVENGVTAEQIEGSYRESKPWTEVQVRDLQRPD